MKKKPKTYSLNQTQIDAVKAEASKRSEEQGRYVSESEVIETLIFKGLKLAKNNKG